MKGFVFAGPKALRGPGLSKWVRRGLKYAESLPAK